MIPIPAAVVSKKVTKPFLSNGVSYCSGKYSTKPQSIEKVDLTNTRLAPVLSVVKHLAGKVFLLIVACMSNARLGPEQK